jgi:LysM repeat protein
MKRFLLLLSLISIPVIAPSLHAQDAATQERLSQLSGKIEDLIAGQDAQKKIISELRKEIEGLRSEQSKPNTTYATPEDLKRLARAIEEVDRKRADDYEKTRTALAKLGQALTSTPPPKKAQSAAPADKDKSATDTKPAADEKGFEYVIKSGDTLSKIVELYKEQNVKITAEQIRKANPGLVPEKMKVGQKLFIPAPAQ